jgi:hypothetical protein
LPYFVRLGSVRFVSLSPVSPLIFAVGRIRAHVGSKPNLRHLRRPSRTPTRLSS